MYIIFKKVPKVINDPMGENSPKLVTLVLKLKAASPCTKWPIRIMSTSKAPFQRERAEENQCDRVSMLWLKNIFAEKSGVFDTKPS
jgi:hypothetical protein